MPDTATLQDRNWKLSVFSTTPIRIEGERVARPISWQLDMSTTLNEQLSPNLIEGVKNDGIRMLEPKDRVASRSACRQEVHFEEVVGARAELGLAGGLDPVKSWSMGRGGMQDTPGKIPTSLAGEEEIARGLAAGVDKYSIKLNRVE